MAYVLFTIISFSFSTLSLAAALWIIGEEGTDPFKTDGVKPTLTKCAGICAVTAVLAYLPLGSLLGLIVWFGGVMIFFNKSLLGAILIAIVGAIVSWVMGSIILSLLTGLLG